MIYEGYISDPLGLSFYFKIGNDRDRLTLYCCYHGANPLEGGIH